MSLWTKIGLAIFATFIMASVLGSQVISINSNKTAQDVIKSKDEQIRNKNQQIDAIRKSRDRSSAAAKKAGEEKVQITCPLFDRVNEFVTVTAQLFDAKVELTPEERAALKPFIEQSKRPAACPPKAEGE